MFEGEGKGLSLTIPMAWELKILVQILVLHDLLPVLPVGTWFHSLVRIL